MIFSVCPPAGFFARGLGNVYGLRYESPLNEYGAEAHVKIACNNVALEAAAKKAFELDYRPVILGSYIIGESREVGLVLSGIAMAYLNCRNPAEPPAAIISGGETTVTIRGKGKKENASYDFFKSLDDLVFTGPAGTNVSDLRVVLAYKK